MSTLCSVQLSTTVPTDSKVGDEVLKEKKNSSPEATAARGKEVTKSEDDTDPTSHPRKRARFTSTALTKEGGRRMVVLRSEDFAVMESPHPYGILPEGNRFFDLSAAAATTNQCPSALIGDEGWYHVLEFCNHLDLGRMLQTCRYFYAVGSEPELWRDLVLRMNMTITVAGPTWKDTLVKLLCNKKSDCANSISYSPPQQQQQPHVPMAVRGVYSDYLYRLHSCRSFTIPASWRDADAGTVPRVPWQEMTMERFERDYERRNWPVVIEGAAKSWKAFERWQNVDYLLEKTTGQKFRATSGAAALPGHFTMQAYLEYCKSSCLEEAPLYLFDRDALKPESPLWKDYMYDLQRTCPYFDPALGVSGTNTNTNTMHHDLFQVLGEGARPDHTWMILGPRRSGSVFHIDPNATHAWNVSIVGSKFWIFYPPGVTPPGVHPSSDGDQVTLPLSLGEWIFQFWDEHEKRKKKHSDEPELRPMECTTLPGDVMFVPHGWWHLVVNLDELNIAITHNYASASNLPSVLKFLSEKRDQVSGCRDRPESIKPERLYEEFVAALQKEHPKVVQRALDDPNWACHAWSSPSTAGTGTSTSTNPTSAKITGRSALYSSSYCQTQNDIGQRTHGGSSVIAKAKSSSAGGGGERSGGFSFSFL